MPPIGRDGREIARWMAALSDAEANRLAFGLCALIWTRSGCVSQRLRWGAPTLGLEIEVSFRMTPQDGMN